MLTLAMLENEQAEPGNAGRLRLGRGERRQSKPTVESHDQVEIRATSRPVPYSEAARKAYAERGWRTGTR